MNGLMRAVENQRVSSDRRGTYPLSGRGCMAVQWIEWMNFHQFGWYRRIFKSCPIVRTMWRGFFVVTQKEAEQKRKATLTGETCLQQYESGKRPIEQPRLDETRKKTR